jgi:hypothetical protein
MQYYRLLISAHPLRAFCSTGASFTTAAPGIAAFGKMMRIGSGRGMHGGAVVRGAVCNGFDQQRKD